MGSSTRKRVRMPLGSEPETTEMWPPLFSTSSRVTQRPMPVPTSCLVVKKGSKMRAGGFGEMP